jgi:two-component system sensor histidine kinase/response regulator
MKVESPIEPGNASILAAEDHPLNQLFLRKMLERFGVGRFEIVPNGLEAFRQYSTGTWNIILMDCHMPELDGYEATKAIREAEKRTGAHVWIVAMTANKTGGEREKCLACGMDEYISKPINVSELKHLLSRWIKFEDDLEAEAPQAKPAWNNQAPVDMAKLQAVAEQDTALQKEMVRAFVDQSEQNAAILKQSCMRKNYKLLKETAHMFKGGAASLGAEALSQLCDRLEQFEGTDGGRMALVEAVNKEYGRVKHYLEELELFVQAS